MITFATAFVILAMTRQVKVNNHSPLRKRHTMLMFILAVLADVYIGIQ